MINPKIKYYIIALLLYFSWVHFATASIVINEFVSHPNQGEKEWVEILNTTGSPVDLTGWKLTELSSPSTTPSENDLISLSGVIINTLVSEVGTTKLNDGGDSIGLYNNNDTLIDRVTYGTESTVKDYSIELIAPAVGKSGVLISGSWITNQTPTKNSVNSSSTTNEEDSESSTTTDLNTVDAKSEIFKITTKIISPKIVTAGIPFSVNSLTTTNTGQTYTVGKFVWNFGDGMMRETGKAESFDYVYEYPGEYVLTLSYFDSVFDKTPDAVNRITIKVVSSGISISSVGNEMDPFIELENKSNYEVVLSDWVITGGIHYFNIPEGTTILPNKKIKLSPKITGFTAEDIRSISVINPSKDIVATYPVTLAKKQTNKNTSTYAIAQNDVLSSNGNIQKDSSLSSKDSQIINLNDLEANVSGSVVGISESTYAWIGLLIVIVLGIASFLIFKNRKEKEPEDYMEKEIRAEDMTIVE